MSVLPVGFGSAAGGTPAGAIERSLRFNSADSAYLNRTPGSAGNRRTFTWSGWVKRGSLSSTQALFESGNGTGIYTLFWFTSSDQIQLLQDNGSGGVLTITTNAVFRDPSAWYHVVITIDTTQATSNNRTIIYVNGINQSLTYTAQLAQNADTWVNYTYQHRLGSRTGGTSYFNGYLTEINFIDGQALTPSSFGETDTNTGVWKPKAFSGTYGTNGFYLKFADNSGTTSTTLGKDSSSNGNNWTPNNFSVTAGAGNDSLVDTPTQYGTDTGVGGEVRGNYATFNALFGTSTLSNGNLQIVGPVGDALRASTLGVASGKWYTEITVASSLSASASMGIAIYNQAALPTVNGTASRGYFYNGQKYSNGTLANYGNSFTNGDVIGIAIDLDNGKLWFSKNGTWQASGDPAAGTNAAYTDLGTTSTWFVTVQTGGATGGATCHANFGQRAFSYTAPSGFKALCTTNLSTPTIGATSTTQAGKYFNPILYTGDGTAPKSFTGVGFQPDFVWIKARSAAYWHHLTDAVRGANKSLYSNVTDAEATSNAVSAFGSDGFTINNTDVNGSGVTYVAWNWKANGAGSSNTAGTISSTVSVNTTAGFSIVTYTGTGSNATVGHGLGVAPSMIILKGRTNADQWFIWHNTFTSSQYIYFNTTAVVSGANPWNSTLPTSTLFSLGTDAGVNGNTTTYVAYCFAPVAGYSAFGSYTGNGSTDGPMIFTGFRPRFVMRKRTDSTGSWIVQDSARPGYNATTTYTSVLYPNASDAELSYNEIDILSNGFKIRATDTFGNASGGTYIYMAIAENPFKYSLAR